MEREDGAYLLAHVGDLIGDLVVVAAAVRFLLVGAALRVAADVVVVPDGDDLRVAGAPQLVVGVHRGAAGIGGDRGWGIEVLGWWGRQGRRSSLLESSRRQKALWFVCVRACVVRGGGPEDGEKSEVNLSVTAIPGGNFGVSS
jgi:hypothetical protein